MQNDRTLTVGELNEYARRLLAADPLLRAVRVRGEVSGFKRHYSGHLYFSIKDETARVQCVMFRQHALGLDFEPADGQMVVIDGAASLYAATGGFQVYCQAMRREGAGALYQRFEALKKRLMEEGLFDAALKKPLPLLPRRVGLVTSPTGAAVRDMIRILRRRNPAATSSSPPCQVQGEGAARDIARALDLLNERGGVEVILCGRGGGSMEDLWAFNEETVARAIARSRVPVVSCVGHETDFTIADFVADARAPRPLWWRRCGAG
jgi:exodeoxyribonuclease VII large subunit